MVGYWTRVRTAHSIRWVVTVVWLRSSINSKQTAPHPRWCAMGGGSGIVSCEVNFCEGRSGQSTA